MNREYRVLLKSIGASMQGDTLDKLDVQGIEWEVFFQLVRKHNVEALVYCTINIPQILETIDEGIREEWKRYTILGGVQQMRNIAKIEGIIKEIQDEDMPVLVLKGITLRNLYKNPSHRTMGDVDFLVHQEHVTRVKEILESKGYSSMSNNGIHEEFECGSGLHIEVHWRLLHGNSFREDTQLDLQVWEKAIPVQLQTVSAWGMNLEEQILFQCAHMMKHVWHTGFGVRQLCDLALLFQHYEAHIDWQALKFRAREDGIEQFLSVMIATCKQSWQIDMTPHWQSDQPVSAKAVDSVLEYLLSNGVHNHSTNQLAETATRFIINQNGTNGKKSLKWLFPTGEAVSDRYAYAKKYKILLPIAWIHRLCSVWKRYGTKQNPQALLKVNAAYKSKAELVSMLGISEVYEE